MRIRNVLNLFILMASTLSSFSARANPDCPKPWQDQVNHQFGCNFLKINVLSSKDFPARERYVRIRSGYLPENPAVAFLGNVIYYEGLGDSMLNHFPLFSQLTRAGYRVIAFDYEGQGGSGGSMNDTRIRNIGFIGNAIWKMHSRDLERFPRKTILGWSTGGLAALVEAQATENRVAKIILIAPGLNPNKVVGEQNISDLRFNQITLATLTSQIYSGQKANPHVDPIKPSSPLEVPLFSWNLLSTAHCARHTPLSHDIPGLVLLSGDEDTYVNAQKTKNSFQNIAPHFEIKQYAHALHEIDNEVDSTSSAARSDILQFLLKR